LSVTRDNEDQLLEHFVAKFAELDDLSFWPHIDPIAAHFSTGEVNPYGGQTWRPIRLDTDAADLDPIYAKLPARLPKLFERLLLSYRWAEVHLDTFTLFANPAGPGLGGWLEQVSHDRPLWDLPIRAGYIPFGKGPDMDYDRVCFDLSSRTKKQECRVVKIDHEEILCNKRLKIASELAPSFRDLINAAIHSKPPRS
jgi:hypothetical protein